MVTTMVPIFFYAVWFLWMSLILGNIMTVGSSAIFDGNATYPGKQQETDIHSIPKVRMRRDLFNRMPMLLYLKMPVGGGETIQLKLMKYESHLANEHLPIMMSSGESLSNVMKNLGEFIIYNDPDKCSTVVYFEKLHSLTGTIGSEYSIMNLPFDFNDYGKYLREVDESYIVKIHNTICPTNLPLPDVMQQASDSHETEHNPSDEDSGPPNKVRRIERSVDGAKDGMLRNMSQSQIGNSRIRRAPQIQKYNLEILVFITHDVVLDFQRRHVGNDDYREALIKYLILYFNNVDMILQKLDGYKTMMQINFAKIIIEDSAKPLDFIAVNIIDFPETVTRLRQHLSDHRDQYPMDSFDYVFISTNRVIRVGSTVVSGMTSASQDIYDARDNRRPYDAVPITALGYAQHYSAAARKISEM